ncbi:glucagon-1-like [Engraulis encrasicolus]|uniref:glucagon-1-like n=1 Tax=Engraulis encrasicolus TaxID=184585 RepID=UPI002FCEBAB1
MTFNPQGKKTLQVCISKSTQGVHKYRKMRGPFWSIFIFTLCADTLEFVIEDQTRLRWWSFQVEDGQNISHYVKRHSDGTFTNDLIHRWDKIKAKDFVSWLASTMRADRSEVSMAMG